MTGSGLGNWKWNTLSAWIVKYCSRSLQLEYYSITHGGPSVHVFELVFGDFGHMEDILNTDLIYVFDVCTRIHIYHRVCTVVIVDTLCFGVTSLNPL